MAFLTPNNQSLRPKADPPMAETAKKGFTLIEMMIVVAIITLLATIGTFSWREVSRRGQASKIASDFRKIEAAWQLWRADTHLAFPPENIFEYAGNADAVNQCNEEGFMGGTALFRNNITGAISPNWQGPYLNIEPRDHTQRRYTYDNDLDPWLESCADVTGGANIQLAYCPAVSGQYEAVAQHIDRAIDGTRSNGECTGKFRWTTGVASPAFLYLLDPN